MPSRVDLGSPPNLFLLLLIDGLFRTSQAGAGARLNLDKDQRLVLDRDQINLGPGRTIIARNYKVTASPQIAGRNFLPFSAEREALAPRQFLIPAVKKVPRIDPGQSNQHP